MNFARCMHQILILNFVITFRLANEYILNSDLPNQAHSNTYSSTQYTELRHSETRIEGAFLSPQKHVIRV